jgi:hypothetical protein
MKKEATNNLVSEMQMQKCLGPQMEITGWSFNYQEIHIRSSQALLQNQVLLRNISISFMLAALMALQNKRTELMHQLLVPRASLQILL